MYKSVDSNSKITWLFSVPNIQHQLGLSYFWDEFILGAHDQIIVLLGDVYLKLYTDVGAM